MLRLTIKKDEKLKIGEDIIFHFQTEGKVRVAIEAPREVRVERIGAEKVEQKTD
jgi:sRNA-binding carbon storage regulator CsrA